MLMTTYQEIENALQGEKSCNQIQPGQYADQETGINHNYFIDYDPSLDRYLESDPIGLEGGLNTYAYVGGNPVNYIDPLGLETFCYKIQGGLYCEDSGTKAPSFPENSDSGSCSRNNKQCDCSVDTKKNKKGAEEAAAAAKHDEKNKG